MYSFWKFHYNVHEEGKIKMQGNSTFVSNDPYYNTEAMKRKVREEISKSDAVLTLLTIQEIGQLEYEEITGKPFTGK